MGKLHGEKIRMGKGFLGLKKTISLIQYEKILIYLGGQIGESLFRKRIAANENKSASMGSNHIPKKFI